MLSGLKKALLLLTMLLLICTLIYSASIDSELIEVRDDLFNSQEELSAFPFKDSLTKEEYDYFSNVKLYLLTGGPGTLLWENFGHSAFIASLPDGRELSFDYGIFEFGDGFYKNFALGRLYYSMLVSYSSYRIDSLISDDRSVELLELELTPLQKSNLIEFLSYNAKKENRTYLYNYYSDNCATRLRDAYNAIENGDFEAWARSKKSNETLRSYSKQYMSRSTFIVDWAINYLLGPAVDNDISLWEAMFLPDVLNASISEYQGNKAEAIYESSSRAAVPASYPFFIYSMLMALILLLPSILLFSQRRCIRRIADIFSFIIYIVLGTMSSVLLFFMCASIHDVTFRNENIIILSPALLILAIFHLVALGKNENRKGISILSAMMLLVSSLMLILKLALPRAFSEDNIEYYITAFAIYIPELIANMYIARKNKYCNNLS